MALLLPGAYAGTADGGTSDGSITGSAPTPRWKFNISVQEGYNDNVFTTSDSSRIKSGFTTATGQIAADFSNSQTLFTIGLGGGVTYYYDRPGDKVDKLANLTINLVHKVNDRLTLTFDSYSTYQVQPQFDLLVQQNRVNGQYFYTAESLSAAYQWTRRFSTVTGYQFTGIFYEDAASRTTGDYIQQTFSNEFRYEVLPTTSAVLEYRLGLVSYIYSPQQNVLTNYFLAGFDHTFSSKFSMSFRAGGQIQDQNVGGSSASPYTELTTTYQYQRYSSLQAYLNYGFQYSNLAVAQNSKAFRLGITINQAITPKLIASLGFFYEHDDYSSTPVVAAYHEDTLNVNFGLRYPITPRLSVSANYQHTSLLSDVSSLEYKQNVVTLGATYAF